MLKMSKIAAIALLIVGIKSYGMDTTTLHDVVRTGTVSEIAVYLAQCGDQYLNSLNNEGNTPLHVAVQRGDIGVIRFLTSIDGINLNIPNLYNHTPLMMAQAILFSIQRGYVPCPANSAIRDQHDNYLRITDFLISEVGNEVATYQVNLVNQFQQAPVVPQTRLELQRARSNACCLATAAIVLIAGLVAFGSQI